MEPENPHLDGRQAIDYRQVILNRDHPGGGGEVFQRVGTDGFVLDIAILGIFGVNDHGGSFYSLGGGWMIRGLELGKPPG